MTVGPSVNDHCGGTCGVELAAAHGVPIEASPREIAYQVAAGNLALNHHMDPEKPDTDFPKKGTTPARKELFQGQVICAALAERGLCEKFCIEKWPNDGYHFGPKTDDLPTEPVKPQLRSVK